MEPLHESGNPNYPDPNFWYGSRGPNYPNLYPDSRMDPASLKLPLDILNFEISAF